MQISALSTASPVVDAPFPCDSEFDLEPAPSSEPRVRNSSPRLSEILWGIDWSEWLPRPVVGDITVDLADFDSAKAFIEAHYAEIFQVAPQLRWFSERGFSRAREQYYRHAADCFAFTDRGRIVGLFLCNPSDWSTYYIRSAAVLPEYSGRHMTQRFLSILLPILERAGVHRVEAETSPSNAITFHSLLRARFSVAGTVLSERWGAIIRLVRHLDPDAERVFGEQFCAVRRPAATDERLSIRA